MNAFIPWNDHMLTGIAIVDAQHKDLVDLINELAPILAQGGREGVHDIIPIKQRLMDHAATHFRTEEDLMAELGVDSRVLDQHRQTHAEFVEKANAMALEFIAGGEGTGVQLLSFLASWLVFHILGENQAMARQIAAIRAGISPAQAYDSAGGARLDPSKEALAGTMTDCYTLMIEQNQSLMLISDHLLELAGERTASLEALTEDLKRARDAAEAANAAKGRFLGMVSHELRTPMNAILGFTDILHHDNLTPRQNALAARIKTAADHLLEQINGILEFSRSEAGVVEPFNLRSVLMEACNLPFAQARAKGLSVHIEIDPTLPIHFLGDARRISLVLRNFAANAAKFTAQGAVSLRARPLSASAEGHILMRFEVRDTGIGIPEAKQAGLFELFHQLDDSATRTHGGVGLGLAMARQAAQMMHGRVGLRSEPGKGSNFWLELSLVPGDEKEEPALSPPMPAHINQRAAVIAPTANATVQAEAGLVLAQLEQLLRTDDTRAASVFEAAAHCLRGALGSRIDMLAKQISDFEYDHALRTLLELQKSIGKP